MRLALAVVAAAVAASGSVAMSAQGRAPAAPLRLSVEEAMRRAERTSEVIAVARSRVDRARAEGLRARSAYLPQIAASGSYDRTLATEFDDFAPAPGTP